MEKNKMEHIRELAEEASIMSKKKKLQSKKLEQKKTTTLKDVNDELKNMQQIYDDDDLESVDSNNEIESNSDASEDNSPNKGELPPIEFREKVVKFIKVDDLLYEKKEYLKKIMAEQIQKTKEEIKELEQQKKPYEEYILKYMEKIQEPSVNIKDGTLEIKVTETKDKISDEIIKESVETTLKENKVVNSDKIVKDVCLALQSKQTIKVKKQLMRTHRKK